MLSVTELRQLAQKMGLAEFIHQIGPFALVQKPPDERVRRKALELGAKRTVGIKLADAVLGPSLLFEFPTLSVATLPPPDPDGRLTVGRLPDCDVVIDDPSVSKRHATITWSGADRRAYLEDLGSSNGTFLNGALVDAEVPIRLQDGDELSFGSARFVFLLAETLYAKVAGAASIPDRP